jgi:O-antigen/teichoic acid export membrane protein
VQVMRTLLNPRLVAIVSRRDHEALAQLVRTWGLGIFALMMLGGAVLIALFPLIDTYILEGRFEKAYVPLIVLVAGLALTSPVLVFSMILTQGGRPAMYSVFMMSTLALNIIANVIGIWIYGLIGAAVGTSLAFGLSAVLLLIMVKKCFGLALWQLKAPSADLDKGNL